MSSTYRGFQQTLGSAMLSRIAALRPDQLESPIEALMAAGFEGQGVSVLPGKKWVKGAMLSKPTIFTQVYFPELKARTDFFIEWRGRFAIECDGREFHHREGSQVVRDYERDRRLLGAGIVTIRFTGGEIFRDPIGCASEALRLAGV